MRVRQDLPADGSRIEGSHKGWNSIMRTHASGLENMLFLCRDFVLRRNIRIATRSEANRLLRPFAASTFGSHHVSFVDFNNRFWNSLITGGRGVPKGKTYPLAPVLEDIASNETFGLVNSASAATFGGLFEVKEEEEDVLDADVLHLHDDLSEDEVVEMMSIDPLLRHRPLTNTADPHPTTPHTSSRALFTTSESASTDVVASNVSSREKTDIELCAGPSATCHDQRQPEVIDLTAMVASCDAERSSPETVQVVVSTRSYYTMLTYLHVCDRTFESTMKQKLRAQRPLLS